MRKSLPGCLHIKEALRYSALLLPSAIKPHHSVCIIIDVHIYVDAKQILV